MVKLAKKMLEIINCLEYKDLLELQKEFSTAGKSTIKNMITAKVKEIEQKDNRQCATCGESIRPEILDTLTLLFGPKDFKKKASFCALDCLEYFFVKLRKLSEHRLKELV